MVKRIDNQSVFRQKVYYMIDYASCFTMIAF